MLASRCAARRQTDGKFVVLFRRVADALLRRHNDPIAAINAVLSALNTAHRVVRRELNDYVGGAVWIALSTHRRCLEPSDGWRRGIHDEALALAPGSHSLRGRNRRCHGVQAVSVT